MKKESNSFKNHVKINIIFNYSSTMRIASDFMVFTKKDSTCTIVLVSRTFFKQENCEDEVIALNKI